MRIAAIALASWLATSPEAASSAWRLMPPPGAHPCLPAAVRDYNALQARGVLSAIVFGRMPDGQTHALVEVDGKPVGSGAWAASQGFAPIAALDFSGFYVWGGE